MPLHRTNIFDNPECIVPENFTLRFLILLLFCLVAFAVAPGSLFAQTVPPKTYEGIWLGALKLPSISLRVVANIVRKPDGAYTVTLDSPDQGAHGIPVDAATFANNMVRIEVKALHAVFEGRSDADLTAIVGAFTQNGNTLPLTLKRVDKVPGLNRPQEPQHPYPYDEEDVTYKNEGANVTLAGTLTKPKTGGPFPVVLLITGSGPQDRDETLLGHKPFLVLADYLTRRGLAVLRVDDRGVAKSTGDFATATSADFATDVLAGVNYLKTRKDVNPAQIGLIGHSEGGLIAPLVATQSNDVAFIVLMAGPGLTGEEILLKQSALINRASGATDEIIARTNAQNARLYGIVVKEKDNAAARKALDASWKEMKAGLTDADKKDPALSDAAMQAQFAQITSPWFRYFLTYDPRPTLQKVACPVLAINGALDLQVPPAEDLAAIETALKAGGNKDYTTRLLPKLNHLFQTSVTGSPSEYLVIEETIAPLALATMGDWIVQHTLAKKSPDKPTAP